MKAVQINTLEIQNVKRIKAVKIDCSGSALTVIGGKNGQGKTSVLDAISYALGGERYRPSNLKREGSIANAEIRVQLSNGLIVERKGKNSSLKVTDPEGGKTGQQLLKEFVSQLAIDLPKFLHCSGTEKAKMLLTILGIGDELEALEKQENKLYDERHALGQITDRKKKFAEEMPCYDDVPEELISASELIQSQQEILARNGENQKKRQQVSRLTAEAANAQQDVDNIKFEIERLQKQLSDAQEKEAKANDDLVIARKSAEQLQDESTAELEKQLAKIEETNAKVSANLDKSKAQDDAKLMQAEYDTLTSSIEAVRKQRMDLLEGANLPLEGLSVEGGNLIFNGQQWDCMSGAEQLRVGTAIARQLNPACGFVLLDKAEQFDTDTLRQFGEWLEVEGLQAIATRVSTGNECSIIIEDGAVEGEDTFTHSNPPSETTPPKFKAGEF